MNNPRDKSRSRGFVWGLLGALIVVLGILLFWQRETPQPEQPDWDKITLPGFSQVLQGTPSHPVRLLFPGPERELAIEERAIYAVENAVDGMRQILILLLSGPRSDGLFPLLPEGVVLWEFYFHQGIAFVDLAVPLEGVPAMGCFEEALALESIRRTLRENFPEIDRVRVLLNGQERATLAGHIALE